MQAKDSTFIHFFLALLLSALFIGFSYQNRLNWLQSSLTRLTSPLRLPATSARLYLQQKLSLLNQLPRQQATIQALKRKNTQLQKQLLKLQDLKEQNQQLKNLLDTPSAAKAPIQPAQITGLSRFAYLDHGSIAHLQPGYAVISNGALLGIIQETHPYTSSVRLLTDPQIQLPAKTAQGQTGQLVYQRQKLHLTQVSPDPQLKIDQAIFTQGTDLIPPSLLIGHITKVQPAQNDIYQSATIKPAINPKTQLQVAVILYQLQP